MPRILITGANGLVGRSLVKRLRDGNELLTPSSGELNLLSSADVSDYFQTNSPDIVFHCAARVGGILANKEDPVGFFTDNMQMGLNVIKSAHACKVNKLINIGSTCIYPKDCPQPMKEEHLLSGELEPTNEGYSLAKISTLRLCEYYNSQYGCDFISVMPTNLFGENDNFNPKKCHAVPAIIRKVKEAKDSGIEEIEVWGDGSPVREFMYVDDLADALIFLSDSYDGSKGFVNVGTGEGKSITELYQTIMDIMGYEGKLVYDPSKPNGTAKKVSDVSKLRELGWESKITLEDGVRRTISALEESGWDWLEK
jgi:GDP-L-fucose synthase